MPYCSDCGRYTESQAFTCRHCGGPLQYAPPPPRPGDIPAPGAFQSGPEPFQNADQEQFLSQFAVGSGCGIYYWSSALFLYYLLAYFAGGFTGGPGTLGVQLWVGTFSRRRRWEALKWRDFEHFRQDERSWELFGAIGYVLNGLILIGLVVALILGAFSGATSGTP